MPKTTKRAATKRAAKIAKAHATELPEFVVREPERRRQPGYKPPARGLARYPWAIAIVTLLLAISIVVIAANHLGPFALPKPAPKATPKVAATTSTTASPCTASGIVSKITDTTAAPTTAQFDAIKHTYSSAPAMTIDTNKVYCAGINTDRGLIVIELKPQWAPNTVNNFVFLAQNKFYDGIIFHRVNPSQIIQTGDPLGTGAGTPGYKFNDEAVKSDYTNGTMAMANSGPNTNGSQFFINLTDNSKTFAKSYNLFGVVVQGLDVANKIQGPGDAASSKGIKPDKMNHVLVVPAS